MKSYGVTIQMKAIEQYFPVVLFIMLYKLALTFESVDEILKCDHSNESYWTVLSCGTVYYAVQGEVLTFEYVDEILQCDHWNESYWAALSCGTVYYAAQGSSIFWVSGRNPKLRFYSNKRYWEVCVPAYYVALNFWTDTMFCKLMQVH